MCLSRLDAGLFGGHFRINAPCDQWREEITDHIQQTDVTEIWRKYRNDQQK